MRFFLAASALVLATATFVRAEGKVDHASWDALLKKYVDDKGLVSYKPLKASDAATLDAYLKSLEEVDEPKLDRNEKLALWINAYNAITVRGILEFYPLKSILEKKSNAPGGYNIWKDFKRKVGGKVVSLDDIEHAILRKMGEPRIHFAIVCASKGCVVLRNEAYDAARLEAQLDDQVQKFVTSSQKFKVEGKTVHLNPIFDWFGEDFGSSKEARLIWLSKHVKDKAALEVLVDKDAKVKFLDWDWSLNEKP